MRELISAEQISARVRELGAEIARDYASSNDLVLIGMLRGAVCFLPDLMRAIDLPLRVGFLGLHRYSGTLGGDLRLSADEMDNVAGADVIVVEDIIEHGTTLNAALELLRDRLPGTISVATLLRKRELVRFAFDELRYVGFEIGPEFVVGYGLDHDQRYRNLPFVAVLEAGDRAE
jgi:hypoxanthine phosphoribosyltransferase